MEYKYTLPKNQIEEVARLLEFANGGTQVRIKTHDGKIHEGILISNCEHIIAMKGHKDLPFSLTDIYEIFQEDDDIYNVERGEWELWDDKFKNKKTHNKN